MDFQQNCSESVPIFRAGFDPLSAPCTDSPQALISSLKQSYYKDESNINYGNYASLKKIEQKQATADFVPPSAFTSQSEFFLKASQFLQYLKEKESNFSSSEEKEETKDTCVDQAQIKQEIEMREIELAWQESVKKQMKLIQSNPAHTRDMKNLLEERSKANEAQQFMMKALSFTLSTVLKESQKSTQAGKDTIDKLVELMKQVKSPLIFQSDVLALNLAEEISSDIIGKVSSSIQPTKITVNQSYTNLLIECVRLVPTLKNIHLLLSKMEKSSKYLTMTHQQIKLTLEIMKTNPQHRFQNSASIALVSEYFKDQIYREIFALKKVLLLSDGLYFYCLAGSRILVIGTGERGTICGFVYQEFKAEITDDSRSMVLINDLIIIYNSNGQAQIVDCSRNEESHQNMNKALANILSFIVNEQERLCRILTGQDNFIYIITEACNPDQTNQKKYKLHKTVFFKEQTEFKIVETREFKLDGLHWNTGYVYLRNKVIHFYEEGCVTEFDLNSLLIKKEEKRTIQFKAGCFDKLNQCHWIVKATDSEQHPFYLEKKWENQARLSTLNEESWNQRTKQVEETKLSQYKNSQLLFQSVVHYMAKSSKSFFISKGTVLNSDGRMCLENQIFGGFSKELLSSLLDHILAWCKAPKKEEEMKFYEALISANTLLMKHSFCGQIEIPMNKPIEEALKFSAKLSKYIEEELHIFIRLAIGQYLNVAIRKIETKGEEAMLTKFKDLLPQIFSKTSLICPLLNDIKSSIQYAHYLHISKIFELVIDKVQTQYLAELSKKILSLELLSYLDFINYYIACVVLFVFQNKQVTKEFKQSLALIFGLLRKVASHYQNSELPPEQVRRVYLHTRVCWHLNNLLIFFLHVKLTDQYRQILMPIVSDLEEMNESISFLDLETGYETLLKNQKSLQSLIWSRGKEKKGPRLPPTNLFPGQMQIDEKIEIVQKAQFLLNSTLFSGGLPLSLIRSLSPSISSLSKINHLFQNNESLQFPLDFQNLPHGQIISSIIKTGKHPPTDAFIGSLCENYGKIKPQSLVGGEDGYKLTRFAFVAMLKYAGLLEAFADLVQETQNKYMYHDTYKKLEQKWAAASNMREWLVGQKNILAQKGQVSKKSVGEVISKVMDKLQFLLQFQRPSVWELDNQENEEDKRAPVLIRSSSSRKSEETENKSYGGLIFHDLEKTEDQAGTNNKIEQWRKKIQDWHLMEKAKRVIKSFELSEAEVFSHVTTSVLAYLQVDLPLNIITHQLCQNYEIICVRAQLIKTLSTGINQSNLLKNYFLATMPLVNKLNKPGEPKHFLRGIRGCGAEVVTYLREMFFQMIERLLERVCQAQELEQNDVKLLMEYLNWKYTARDHSKLFDLKLIEVITGQIKSALASSWLTSSGSVDPVVLSSALKVQQTFYQILLQIALRATTEELESKEHNESMITVPSLLKFKSALNVNHSETLLQSGLNHVLIQLHYSAQLCDQSEQSPLHQFLCPLMVSLSQLIKLMSSSQITSPILVQAIASQTIKDVLLVLQTSLNSQIKLRSVSILKSLLTLLPYQMYQEAAHFLKSESIFEIVFGSTLSLSVNDRFSLLFRREALSLLRELVTTWQLSSFVLLASKFQQSVQQFSKKEPKQLRQVLQVLGGELRNYKEGQRVVVHNYEDIPLQEEGVIISEQGDKIPVILDKAEIKCNQACLSLLEPESEELIKMLDQSFIRKLSDFFISLASSKTQNPRSIDAQIRILKILKLKQSLGYRLEQDFIDFLGEEALRFNSSDLTNKLLLQATIGELESQFFIHNTTQELEIPKMKKFEVNEQSTNTIDFFAKEAPLSKSSKYLSKFSISQHPPSDQEHSSLKFQVSSQYQNLQHALRLKLIHKIVLTSAELDYESCKVNSGMLLLFSHFQLEPYLRNVKKGHQYTLSTIQESLNLAKHANNAKFINGLRAVFQSPFQFIAQRILVYLGYSILANKSESLLFEKVNGAFLFEYILISALNISLADKYLVSYHSWYLHCIVARIFDCIDNSIDNPEIDQILTSNLLASTEYHEAISISLAGKPTNDLASFGNPCAALWIDVARYIARIEFKKIRLFPEYRVAPKILELLVKNGEKLKEVLYAVDTNREELAAHSYFMQEMKDKAMKCSHWFECTSSLSLCVTDALSIHIGIKDPNIQDIKRLKNEIVCLRSDQGQSTVIRLEKLQSQKQPSFSNKMWLKIQNLKSLSPMVMAIQNRKDYLTKIVEPDLYFNELDLSEKFNFKIIKSYSTAGSCLYLLESGHLITQKSVKDVEKSDTMLIDSDVKDFGFCGSLNLSHIIMLKHSGELVIIKEGKKIYEKQTEMVDGHVRFLKKMLCAIYTEKQICFFHLDGLKVKREEIYDLDDESSLHFIGDGSDFLKFGLQQGNMLYLANPRGQSQQPFVIPLPEQPIKKLYEYSSRLYAFTEHNEIYQRATRGDNEWEKVEYKWPAGRTNVKFQTIHFSTQSSMKMIGVEVITGTELQKRLVTHKQVKPKEEIKKAKTPIPATKKVISRPPSGILRPSATPKPSVSKRPVVAKPSTAGGFAARKVSTPYKKVMVKELKKPAEKVKIQEEEVKLKEKIVTLEEEKKKIEEDEPKEPDTQAVWLYQIELKTNQAIVKDLDYVTPQFQLLGCSIDNSNIITKLLKHKDQTLFSKARLERSKPKIIEQTPQKGTKFSYVCAYPIQDNRVQLMEEVALQIDKTLGEPGETRYICNCKVGYRVLSYNLSQAQFQDRCLELWINLPLIFIKTQHQVEALPIIRLDRYYKTENLLGNNEIEVYPGLISLPEEEEEKQGKQAKKLMESLEEQLLEQKSPLQYCKESSSLMSFIDNNFKIKEDKKSKLNPKESKEFLKRQALKHFKVLQCLCVANFRALSHLPSSSISSIVIEKKAKRVPFILKNAWLRCLCYSMKRGRSLGWTQVDRFKAKSLARKGMVDIYGHFTMFAQTMDHVDSNVTRMRERYSCLKVRDCHSNPWQYRFTGEKGYDIGGLTREGIDEIACELQSPALTLLIPTPNNRNQSGEMRECWMVNPVLHDMRNKEMLRFLGGMLGMTLSGDRKINLDFTNLFYKKITGQEIKDEDLKEIDHFSVKSLENLEELVQQEGLRVEDVCEEYFTTCLSSGEAVELIPQGETVLLTNENLQDYIDKVKKKRVAETNAVMEVLLSGFRLILNPATLKLFKAVELKKLIEGSRTITVSGLKRITESPESCETKKMFWKVLKTLSQSDRAKYLRFVWGRSRLPHEGESLSEKHKIDVCDSKGNKKLPVGHTCFFTLDLPRYTKEEIMREKLVYAINNCQAIDGDSTSFVAFYDEDNL